MRWVVHLFVLHRFGWKAPLPLLLGLQATSVGAGVSGVVSVLAEAAIRLVFKSTGVFRVS